MGESILLNEKQLQRYVHMIPDRFLEHTWAEAALQFWGMERAGIPYAIAVTDCEGDTFMLQYIYITEKFRGMGKGTQLMTELLLYAYHAKRKSFQIRCLAGEYKKLERMLGGYPFQREEEGLGSFSCQLSELVQNPYFQGSYGNVAALADCSSKSLRAFSKKLERWGEELIELPLDKSDYLAECSSVVLEKGKIKGILLIRQEQEKKCRVCCLLSHSTHIAAPIWLLRYAIQRAGSCCPPDTLCHFEVVNKTLLRILEKMGVKAAAKRWCYTLELSYFARYEAAAWAYANGTTEAIENRAGKGGY